MKYKTFLLVAALLCITGVFATPSIESCKSVPPMTGQQKKIVRAVKQSIALPEIQDIHLKCEDKLSAKQMKKAKAYARSLMQH